jgi:choline dehydrogenase
MIESFRHLGAVFGPTHSPHQIMERPRLSTWQPAEKAVAAVYRLTEDLNIATLHDLGIEEQEIPFLAEIAAKDPQTIGNPRDIDRPGYEKVWRRAFELGKE